MVFAMAMVVISRAFRKAAVQMLPVFFVRLDTAMSSYAFCGERTSFGLCDKHKHIVDY